MKITVSNEPAAELDTDALVLALPEGSVDAAPWEAVDAGLDGQIRAVLEGEAFSGKQGQSHALSTLGRLPVREVILVGRGPDDAFDLEAWRTAVAAGCKAARARGCQRVGVPLPELEADAPALAGATTEAGILGCYRFHEYKSSPSEQTEIEELVVATADGGATHSTQRARTVAEATCWARDLVNRPGNAKRPPVLAEMLLEMAAEHGLDSRVVDEAEAAEIGLEALLAVGGGSDAPPRLVVLEHAPGGADEAPVLLVGKGITFDSGGISIKRSSKMGDMKGDMGGAAAVAGTMRALAALGVDRRVVGVTPLAENLPSSSSYRPGDIIRPYGDTTIEVVNTDAEGRLVLADALAWACEQYEPDSVVDLATLTGACVVALGTAAAGLMGTDDDLCAGLLAAGESTGDRLWRLPLWSAYDKLIDADVADVKNSGGRDAGAITAGKFLQRFVGDARWAHIDIAGPSFLSKSDGYRPSGGTGFGVRLLTEWLQR